jgi:uncharacterized membrane protein
MDEKKTAGPGLGRKLRDYFIAGVLLVVPLGASILILIWLFNSIDHILQPVINFFFGKNIPGVGFGVTVIVIFLAGMVARNFFGRKIIGYGESLLSRVPVFHQLYNGIKQVLESFAAPDKTGFMHVVLVEFPRKGIWALGFVTNEIADENGDKLINVLIPTSPNPTSGFLQIVKEKDVLRTKISVDAALKMVVSGGRMTPNEVREKMNFQGKDKSP